MLEPEQYQELLEHLKLLVKDELKKEERLWDRQDIAEYFKVSVTTVDRYRKQPGFPQAIHIPYEKSKGHIVATMRWYPKEIKLWGLRLRVA